MKLHKWLSIFCLLVMLLTLVLPAAATEAAAPETQSPKTPAEQPLEGFQITGYPASLEIFRNEPRSAMLIELNTGTVLYALDIHEQNYPASLTKIMTCLLALERGNLDDVLTVSATALQGLHEAGSTADLVEGEQMTLRNMLYCTMVASANEACNVIAEYISGSVDAFVTLMNQRALELGCTGTNFANPHGLHDDNHFTTAYDLSLITREALKYDEFRKITGTATYVVPATNMSAERKLTSTNELIVDAASSSYFYSKATGIKTGFTTPAQACLVSTATDGEMNLLSVMMGSQHMLDEDSGMWVKRSFPESINLHEYGFTHYKFATVLSTLYPVAEIQVNQSASSQTVALAPATEVRSLIDFDFDPDEIILDIYLPSSAVDAPVEAGQVLGSATVTYRGMKLGQVDLTAITSVARSEITHKADNTKTYVENNWWKWLVGILVGCILLLFAYVVLMQVLRRQSRKRKIAARRRALELERRKQRLRENWPQD